MGVGVGVRVGLEGLALGRGFRPRLRGMWRVIEG